LSIGLWQGIDHKIFRALVLTIAPAVLMVVTWFLVAFGQVATTVSSPVWATTLNFFLYFINATLGLRFAPSWRDKRLAKKSSTKKNSDKPHEH
jgi:hypothetical protein